MEQTKLIGHMAWEMEDFLQFFETTSGRPPFCSMFNENKSASIDAYGTCLNYTEAIEAWDGLKAKYNKEDILDSIKYWLENENVGVPLKILATFMKEEVAN